MSRQPKHMDLVQVEWWDHSSRTDRGWYPLESHKAEAAALKCISVGFVAHRDKDVTVIIPHVYVAEEGWQQKGCGDMTLINKAIHSIKILKRA